MDWLEKVEELDAELEAHVKSLGGGGWDDLDEEIQAAIMAMQPKTWPLLDNDDLDDTD